MKPPEWIIVAGLFLILVPLASAGVYVVNVNSDLPDLNPGDGICHCGGVEDCSFRAAIQEANLDGAESYIGFSYSFMGASAIAANNLPMLTEDHTIIDASSRWQGTFPDGQPGVELNGQNNTSGMIAISGDLCEIYGLLFKGSANKCIRLQSCSGNSIGSDSTGRRNVFISEGMGVCLEENCNTNVVIGNFFGTLDGIHPYAEFWGSYGIVDEGNGSFIWNNVAGSLEYGIYLMGQDGSIRNNVVGKSYFSDDLIPNQTGIGIIGQRYQVHTNVVTGNYIAGFELIDDTSSEIVSNVIGDFSEGEGNGGCAISMNGSELLRLEGNIILSNKGSGIQGISNSGTILGCTIQWNESDGIRLEGNDNFIAENWISGNSASGIALTGASSGNIVRSNFIGHSDNMQDSGNGGNGIVLDSGCHFNTIGGSGQDQGNWIGWNKGHGIFLTGAGTSGNIIEGNFIGRTLIELSPAPNSYHGIALYDGAENNLVGRYPDAPNIVLSSGWSGVAAVNTADNDIAYNWIGYSTDLISGNKYYGVHVVDSSGNRIRFNHVAYNGSATDHPGILIQGAASTGNRISQNSIHEHMGAGIALVSGGNALLQAPTIIQASASHVEGTACPRCEIEIFSDSKDEGRIYHTSVQSDASGNFKADGLFDGPLLTATATDADFNTSTFSEPYLIAMAVINLEMPGHYFSPGSPCYLKAVLTSDQVRNNVPFFVILDVLGAHWFWPGWSQSVDNSFIDLGPGSVELEVIPGFTWPDTGTAHFTGIVFWGALLNEEMTEILGGESGYDRFSFDFGPA